MSAPNQPGGDWDDTRLDAAFRARFDALPPSGLVDRIQADLHTRRPTSWLASFRTSTLGLAGIAAIGVAVVIGSQLGIGRPGAGSSGPATQAPTATRPVFSSPPSSAEVEFPATVVMSGTGYVLPVVSVAEATFTRDAGVDPVVIAVGGWYVPWQSLPCPIMPDEYQPLEGCYLDSSWLLDAPDALSQRGPNGPIPALHPVTDLDSPGSEDRAPEPVVFIGHFDDVKATECPAGQRRQACADRFVVDQVAWTSKALTTEFPTTAVGLPVITVDAATSVRDMGLGSELAIAGWYQSPQPMPCPFVPAVAVPFLEGDCALDQTWLMANPESLIHVAPATGPGPDGMQISGRHPANSAVNVAFAGVMPPATRPLPVEGDSTPAAVVFVGHFNDGRADLCSVDGAIACHRRFVVDAIAWVDGSAQTVPTLVDQRDGGAPSETQAQQGAATAFLASRQWVLNTMLIPGSRIGALEPALAHPDLRRSAILSNEPVVWLATALELYDEPLGFAVRTYVIDGQGQVYVDTAGVVFVRQIPK